MSFVHRLQNPAPPGYVTPSFPSLYWPFPGLGSNQGAESFYLYHTQDIWRFTLLWTILFYAAVHLATSGYAVLVQLKNWKVVWVVPVVYFVVGGIEAFIAGSIVGGLLGAIYNAGFFRMSTWIPFVWAFINTLILILSSFAIQGGL
ncbi:hypothetical protein P152DRAFT_171866 [Eremomyces bilateralis CBS 781.70]|uniref:Integral membrane protein n=1 Tax=Eremomyces bilateralis CBS 781.70 TaxID=1392243 RepID=A0A6G1FTQ2_9PEZI|nr:uncharacterized protein P152DRAFT_171866 [Eremomyces bilateralis CBS 781.70]KAF1809177.1 hypothetical protein P152DRAFT_171866 [Eremomyces bilateralis CBS 781.70]